MDEVKSRVKKFRDDRLTQLDGESFRLNEERKKTFFTSIEDIKKVHGTKGNNLRMGTSMGYKRKLLWKEQYSDGESFLGKSSSKLKEHLERFVHERHSEEELKGYEEELGKGTSSLGDSRKSSAKYTPRGRIR